MKTETYINLKATVADFDTLYTSRVPTSQITYNRKVSQVRQAGHVTANVARFAEIMKANPGTLPPASVKRLANGQYELKDGCTRELAAAQIKGDLWVSWYHDVIHSPTPDEWEDLQMEFNDHPLGQASSADDIGAYLSRQQQSGAMTLKVGFPYQGRETGYIKAAAKVYRAALPNSGKTLKWYSAKVEAALKGHIGIKYENYTKSQLFDLYKGTSQFAGARIGEISNDEAVFAFTQLGHRNPNVIGSIADKRMDNPNVQYTLVYCVGRLAGKDDQALKDERQAITDWANKINQHYPGWIGKLYFAPQIKTGPNKETMWALIQAI